MPKKKPKRKKLTPEQERFVDEYVISLNATTAYQRAYPESSYSAARRSASDLLTKPDVKAAVAAAQKELRKRSGIDALKVVTEYARLAFSDIENVVDLSDPDKPRLRERDKIDPETRRAVQEISRTQHGVKVKLASKAEALDKLMRHLGLYKDLPPLEVLLDALPAPIAAAVRAALAAQVQRGGSEPGVRPGDNAGLGTPPQRPGTPVPGDGVDPGPVAGEFPLFDQ